MVKSGLILCTLHVVIGALTSHDETCVDITHYSYVFSLSFSSPSPSLSLAFSSAGVLLVMVATLSSRSKVTAALQLLFELQLMEVLPGPVALPTFVRHCFVSLPLSSAVSLLSLSNVATNTFYVCSCPVLFDPFILAFPNCLMMCNVTTDQLSRDLTTCVCQSTVTLNSPRPKSSWLQ